MYQFRVRINKPASPDHGREGGARELDVFSDPVEGNLYAVKLDGDTVEKNFRQVYLEFI